jgi:hypothetical protein
MVAVIGDVRRFPTARHLVGYLGLSPRSASRANAPARRGRVSKEGPAAARHVHVEAAKSRTAARRGGQVAIVAVGRKLAMLAWQLLARGEDYDFERPSLVRPGLRAAQQDADLEHRNDAAGRRLAARPEVAYRRLMADWQASGPKRDAGAAPRRAFQRPPPRQAARQVRESLRWLVEELMEPYAEQIGVRLGERRPEDRATRRNGYRAPRWDTRAGEVELQIPKLCQGSYFPSFLQLRKRSEQALVSVVQQALRVSRSEVSRISEELDEQVQAFRSRPLACFSTIARVPGAPCQRSRRHAKRCPPRSPSSTAGCPGPPRCPRTPKTTSSPRRQSS